MRLNKFRRVHADILGRFRANVPAARASETIPYRAAGLGQIGEDSQPQPRHMGAMIITALGGQQIKADSQRAQLLHYIGLLAAAAHLHAHAARLTELL